MDRYLYFTWLLIWPVSMLVLYIVERRDRIAYEAREDQARLDRMRTFDAEVDALFVDTAALLEDGEVDLEAIWDLPSPPGARPLRPFDPAPHTYPRRPARHGSRNRLHRGF